MDYKSLARTVFLLSAIYYFILGILFFFFFVQIFNFFSIEIPNFPQYIQLSAAFVAVLGVAYFLIYLNLGRNRDLWKIGTVYKAVYILIVAYHYLITKQANIIFFYFALIDVVFLAFFIGLYNKVYR
jgi:hypothetical protein